MASLDDRSTVIPGADRRTSRRAVVAASIGNALEWYDIMIYSYFAVVISALFFPAESEFVALLLTFGTFAISYVIRPIGAVVIGNIGDRRGRKAALNLTIVLMFVGTLVLTLAPTHAQIGVGAAVLVLGARLLQGFSAGGEFGSATAFVTENARRGKAFYASWQSATQGAALLLAAVVGLLLTTGLSEEQLYSGGWRTAFAVGLLIGPVGLYIRLRMDDTPEFRAAETVKSPIRETLRSNRLRIVTAAGCVGLGTVSMYLLLYMPTFAIANLGLPSYAAYIGGAIGGATVLVAAPLIGGLADRVGCTPIMGAAGVCGAVLFVPMFALLSDRPSVLGLTLFQAVLGLVLAFYFAPLPALLSSLFPTNVRVTGMSIAYNLGVLLFGGTAPLVFTTLLETTGSPVSPAYFMVSVAVVSVLAVIVARRRFAQR